MTSLRTRGVQDLFASGDRVLQHPAAVRAERVVDLRRRDPAGVLQHRVQRHRVVRLGQVLADREHAGRVLEHLPIRAVVPFAPGYAPARHSGQRREHGAPAPAELVGVAAHEAPAAIRLIELLAPDADVGPAVAVDRRIEDALDRRVGMEHQVPADLPARVGEAVRKPRRDRVEQDPRGTDTVAGENDHLGRLEMLDAVGVVVDRAARHASIVGRDLAHAAPGAQFDPLSDRLRPVGDVGARLGALRAPGDAVAEIDAPGPPFVVPRRHCAVRGPPVPAERVHRTAPHRARLAQRQRRHDRVLGRVGGIPRQSRDPHHPVVQRVVRLEGRIVDRPVLGHAVERANPEVRRVHAREVSRIEDRAPAHTVEVRDLDRRGVFVDRIVGRVTAHVGADAGVGELARFPVATGAGEIGRLCPAALLQAQDAHPRLGQAPGERRAGRAGADDQYVDR